MTTTGTTAQGGAPDKPDGAAVRLERTLAAPRARVWAAWTDPALMARWYCPNPDLPVEVTADVVVGGRYRVDMGSGSYVAEGVYTDVDEPGLLAFTWRWAHEDATSHVRVELGAAADGGTHLVLLHAGLVDDEDAAGHTEGWEMSLGRLVGVL